MSKKKTGNNLVKKKPALELVKTGNSLTIKQQAFVDEIIKGKLGSYKEAYAKAYDVQLTKKGTIPKWVEVEASRLVCNPKISLSIQRALEKKETNAVASSLRTRNYVIEELYRQSKEADTSASQVRSLELLGKSIGLFSDVLETKEARQSSDIEAEIEDKINRLLEDQSGS
jgi:organic radical activating enzyme